MFLQMQTACDKIIMKPIANIFKLNQHLRFRQFFKAFFSYAGSDSDPIDVMKIGTVMKNIIKTLQQQPVPNSN
jgi:hypothetical protein